MTVKRHRFDLQRKVGPALHRDKVQFTDLRKQTDAARQGYRTTDFRRFFKRV